MAEITGIGKNICDAVKIYVEAQKEAYDRTIQGTITDILEEQRALKVKYQDTIITAYLNESDNIRTYQKNANVYVNILNNDLTERKVVLGLVEQTGDVAFLEEDPYYKQGEVIQLWNTSTELTPESQESSPSIVDGALASLNDILRYNSNESIQHFLFSLPLSVKISPFLSNLQDYKVCISCTVDSYIDDKGQAISLAQDNTRNYTIVFGLDDVYGDPYHITESQQEIQRTFTFDLDDRTYYITHLAAIEVTIVAANLRRQDQVIIGPCTMQSIGIYSKQELMGYNLKITASKTIFNKNALDSETITLTGVAKYNNILQSLSGARCYWFEYDGKTNQTSNSNNNGQQRYNSKAGVGWYWLNPFDEQDEEDTTAVGAYTYTIVKKEFVVPQKTYKLVAEVNGARLEAEIVIRNNKQSFQFDIEELNEDQYRAQLTKDGDRFSIPNIKDGVTYTADYILINSAQVQIEQQPENGIVTLDRNFSGVRVLRCNFYQEINERKMFIGRVEKEVKGAIIPSGYISIENGEQVFLYENNGEIINSPIADTATHQCVTKTLSAKLYGEVEPNETITYHWFIPNVNKEHATLIKMPKDTRTALDLGVESIWERVNGITSDWYEVISSKLIFSINSHYETAQTYNNICVVAVDSNRTIKAVNWTYFTFVQEGEVGTLGTGVYCRIVPNCKENTNMPLYGVIQYYKKNNISYAKMNYQLAANDTDELRAGVNYQPFRVQLWYKNEKIFDGIEQRDDVTLIDWQTIESLSPVSEDNVLKLSNSSQKGEYQINYEFAANKQNYWAWNQWIAVSLSYKRNTYTNYYPLILQRASADTQMPFAIINNGVESLRNIISYNSNGGVINETYKLSIDNHSDEYQLISNEDGYQYCTVVVSEDVAGTDVLACDVTFNKYYKSASFLDKVILARVENSEITDIYASVPFMLTLSPITESDLAEWDGVTAEIKQDSSEVFAQKYIAGKKENNKLQGIIAGYNKTNNVEENGYGTYHNGVKTSFIQAKNGQSTFGVTVDQQIQLKPTTGGGLIQSPLYSKSSGTGMSINITKPSIQFADAKKFSISTDEKGYLNEWAIDSNSIIRKDKNLGVGSDTEFTIKEWTSESIQPLPALWTKNTVKNQSTSKFASLLTMDGHFSATQLLIRSADFNNKIPTFAKKASTVNDSIDTTEISNAIGIGMVLDEALTYKINANRADPSYSQVIQTDDDVNNMVKTVIPQINSIFAKDANNKIKMLLNPWHFNFGDDNILDISREGVIKSQLLSLRSGSLEEDDLKETQIQPTRLEMSSGYHSVLLGKKSSAPQLLLKVEDPPKAPYTNECSVQLQAAMNNQFQITTKDKIATISTTGFSIKKKNNNGMKTTVELRGGGLQIDDFIDLQSSKQRIGNFTFEGNKISSSQGKINFGSNVLISDGVEGVTYTDQFVCLGMDGKRIKLRTKNGLVTGWSYADQDNMQFAFKDGDGNTITFSFCNGVCSDISKN